MPWTIKPKIKNHNHNHNHLNRTRLDFGNPDCLVYFFNENKSVIQKVKTGINENTWS